MLTAQKGALSVEIWTNAYLRLQEQLANGKSAHNGTGLAAGSGDAVQGGPELGGKQLHGDDEGRGVGAKVGEEEGEGVQDNERPLGGVVDGVVGGRQDDQDDSHHGEPCQCQACTTRSATRVMDVVISLLQT